jgi:hypothetical protein
MPFALLIIGAVLLTASVRNTQDDLFTLVKGDFSGQGNFIFWVVSLLIIGAIGYIPKLKPISDGFLVLVLIVMFLTKGNPSGVGGGFFEKFTTALKGTTQTTPSTSQAASTQPVSTLQPLQPLGDLQSV